MKQLLKQTSIFILLFTALLGVSTTVHAAQGEHDIVVKKDGKHIKCFVQEEGFKNLTYKVTKSQKDPSTVRMNDVVEIRYSGMDTGYWQRAMRALERGQWEGAAGSFLNVYKSRDQKKWRGAYGLFGLSAGLEELGEYEKAAKFFGKLATDEDMAGHRLVFNALYRQGICLARAGKGDEARAVAKTVEARRSDFGSAATGRAAAIVAVVDITSGKGDRVNTRKVRFSYKPEEKMLFAEKDMWLHWQRLWGSVLEDAKSWDKAIKHYKKTQEVLGGNLKMSIPLSVKLARCFQEKGDKESAMLHCINADTLPFATDAELAYARFTGAAILLELSAAKLADTKDTEKVAYGESQKEQARWMLQAVVNTKDEKYAAQAAELLATIK